MSNSSPPATICVLVYGDYPDLASRCLESIRLHCDRALFRCIVGANCPGKMTLKILEELKAAGFIDRLIISPVNINKCPMMRRMFAEVDTEYIWWFDDDCCVTSSPALPELLARARSAAPEVVLWGEAAFCDHPLNFWHSDNAVEFVRTASWYCGLTPPFWAPGGKGELNFNGRGGGDGRWHFIVGGSWFCRAKALRHLDWPDRRLIKQGDDVLLGEAVRQQGWKMQDTRSWGVLLGLTSRRGDPGICLE
jgi:GT2 family glycosyltransferase